MRSLLVAKRGSSASSGSPIAGQNRFQISSLPTAITISPSAVVNVSYGAMVAWRLPLPLRRLAGREPVRRLVGEQRRGGVEHADVDALARARCARARSSAAVMPCAQYRPATMSVIATPRR